MTIKDIEKLISGDETSTLELKKSTGEMKDAMHSACAFLNTDGGWLVFGVTPSSLKIVGQDVTDNTRMEIANALSKIEPSPDVLVEYVNVSDNSDKQVVAMHFDSWVYGKHPFTYNGCPYYRLESTTCVMPKEVFEERLRDSDPRKFAWENKVADGFSLSDLDEEMIRGVVRSGINGGRMPAVAVNDSIESILNKWHLIDGGKVSNAAVALFAKDIKDYSQLIVRLACFKGTDKIMFLDNKMIEGNIFKLFSDTMDFFFKHLNLNGEVIGEKRVENLEIPVEALREAMINALCHRRYDDYRETVSVAIYSDRVEIVNPGKLPYPLDAETIKLPHESKPHNYKIAQVLYKSNYLESWGTGYQRMSDACKSVGISGPVMSCESNLIRVSFARKGASEGVNVGGNDEMSVENVGRNDQLSVENVGRNDDKRKKRHLAIIDIIKGNPNCTQSQMAELLGVSEKTIERDTAELQSSGIIKYEGEKKNGAWVLR